MDFAEALRASRSRAEPAPPAGELGSGQLILARDQLSGAKAGDEREVKVSVSGTLPAENLKGKDATFAVTSRL